MTIEISENKEAFMIKHLRSWMETAKKSDEMEMLGAPC